MLASKALSLSSCCRAQRDNSTYWKRLPPVGALTPLGLQQFVAAFFDPGGRVDGSGDQGGVEEVGGDPFFLGLDGDDDDDGFDVGF